MKTITVCPICGSENFTKVLEAPYFRGDHEKFSICECESCKLWITSPRPDDPDLGRYYETGEYISHNNKREGLTDVLYHWVREYSLGKKLQLINRLVPTKGRLLDYGAGTGHFLATAKKDHWLVEGVEPSAEAREIARAENQLTLNDPEDYKWNGTFEAITLWHVLEHLPELQDHLKRFSHALTPGGYLVIAVPNHDSADSKKYGASWAALDVPLHLYHFKKTNIKDLACQHGLALEEIRNMPFDSFYVSMLSEKIKSGKSNLLKAFWSGLVSNLKGAGSKNMSSLIYILRKPE
jgi:2-polyprenyl-3-methyl-5-hydroxy-6-metoxy-1,4-benzoquinol methylase